MTDQRVPCTRSCDVRMQEVLQGARDALEAGQCRGAKVAGGPSHKYVPIAVWVVLIWAPYVDTVTQATVATKRTRSRSTTLGTTSTTLTVCWIASIRTCPHWRSLCDAIFLENHWISCLSARVYCSFPPASSPSFPGRAALSASPSLHR